MTFVLAWITGMGIITYRTIKADHAPPVPGQLAAASLLFVMLAGLAQVDKARFIAVAMAWGFDAAAFLNLFGMPQFDGSSSRSTISDLTSSIQKAGS